MPTRRPGWLLLTRSSNEALATFALQHFLSPSAPCESSAYSSGPNVPPQSQMSAQSFIRLSGKIPPSVTIICTWGWWVLADRQVYGTAVTPILAPKCLGSAAMVVTPGDADA